MERMGKQPGSRCSNGAGVVSAKLLPKAMTLSSHLDSVQKTEHTAVWMVKVVVPEVKRLERVH